MLKNLFISFVLITFCFFFLYSCQSRYGYRAKVRVHPAPVQTNFSIDTSKIKAPEEALTEVVYHEAFPVSISAITMDSTSEPVAVTSRLASSATDRKEYVDSKHIKPNQKVTTTASHSSKTIFKIAGILLLGGLILITLGILADISLLVGLGSLSLSICFIAFIVALLVWAMSNANSYPSRYDEMKEGMQRNKY